MSDLPKPRLTPEKPFGENSSSGSYAFRRDHEKFLSEGRAQSIPSPRLFGGSSVSLTPVELNGAAATPSDPDEISERRERKLTLQWEELKGKHGFDGGHLKWHDQRRFLELFGVKPQRTDQIIGIEKTSKLASERFSQVAYEHLKAWASDGLRIALYEQRLEDVARSVLAEVSAVWSVDDWHREWFERECVAPIGGLKVLIRPWEDKARSMEIQRLENPLLNLLDLLKSEGDQGTASLRQRGYEALYEAMVPPPEYKPLPEPPRAVGGFATAVSSHVQVTKEPRPAADIAGSSSGSWSRSHVGTVHAPNRGADPTEIVQATEREGAGHDESTTATSKSAGELNAETVGGEIRSLLDPFATKEQREVAVSLATTKYQTAKAVAEWMEVDYSDLRKWVRCEPLAKGRSAKVERIRAKLLKIGQSAQII